MGISIAVICCVAGYSRSGTGYFFDNKRVMKKFYIGPKSHKRDKISRRVVKSEDIIIDAKAFNMSTSARSGKPGDLLFFEDSSALRSLPVLPSLKKVFHLRAHFKFAKYMFVDLRPKKPINLPSWTKSVDFMVKGIGEKLEVILYFDYPDGRKMRHVHRIKQSNRWFRVSINLVKGRALKLGAERPIRLSKIRFMKEDLASPADYSIYTADFHANNFLKTESNSLITAHRVYSAFEKRDPAIWHFSVDNERLPDTVWSLNDHLGASLLWESNKRYMRLSIDPSQHKQGNIFIRFPSRAYPLDRGHQITLWVKGAGRGEELSIIFQEGKYRYFELQIAELNFTGWKKLTAKIPSQRINYFIDRRIDWHYIYVLGIKLSGMRANQPVDLGIDQLEAVVDPAILGDIKDL